MQFGEKHSRDALSFGCKLDTENAGIARPYEHFVQCMPSAVTELPILFETCVVGRLRLLAWAPYSAAGHKVSKMEIALLSVKPVGANSHSRHSEHRC